VTVKRLRCQEHMVIVQRLHNHKYSEIVLRPHKIENTWSLCRDHTIKTYGDCAVTTQSGAHDDCVENHTAKITHGKCDDRVNANTQ